MVFKNDRQRKAVMSRLVPIKPKIKQRTNMYPAHIIDNSIIKEIKSKGGHILDIITVAGHNNRLLVYYREVDTYPSDVKIKTIQM